MKQKSNYVKLTELLRSVGNEAFVDCYDIVKKNYTGNKMAVKQALIQHGLKNGKRYSYGTLTTKVSHVCSIFKHGWEYEALRICGAPLPEDAVEIPFEIMHNVPAPIKKPRKTKTKTTASTDTKTTKKRRSRALDKTKYTYNKSVISTIEKLYERIGREFDKSAAKYGKPRVNSRKSKSTLLSLEIKSLKSEIERLKKELAAAKKSA